MGTSDELILLIELSKGGKGGSQEPGRASGIVLKHYF